MHTFAHQTTSQPRAKGNAIHWYYWPLIIWLGAPFIFIPLWHIALTYGRRSWDPEHQHQPQPQPILLLEGPTPMTPLDILIHTTNELGRCLDNISSLSPSPPFITREVIIQLTRLWSLSNSATLSLDLSVKPKIIQPDYFQGPSE